MEGKWKKGIGWLLGIALLIVLRRTIGRIALLLLVASTLAYLLCPLERLFRQRLRLSQGLASVLAFASAALALAVLAVFGIPALLRQVAALGQSAPQLVESFGDLLRALSARMAALGLPEETVLALQSRAGDLLTLFAEFLFSRLMQVVQGVSNLGYLLFAPVLAFYMLRDRRRLFAYLTRLIPSRVRKPVLRVALAVRDAMAAYVHGQLTVSAITGTLTALGLLVIGLPAWLALGLVMAVCNLIPYFGPWLGMIPIALFSVTEGSRPSLAASRSCCSPSRSRTWSSPPRHRGHGEPAPGAGRALPDRGRMAGGPSGHVLRHPRGAVPAGGPARPARRSAADLMLLCAICDRWIQRV